MKSIYHFNLFYLKRFINALLFLFLFLGFTHNYGGTYYWVGGNNSAGSPGTFNTLSNWNSTIGGGGTTPGTYTANTFIIDGSNVGGGMSI